MRTRTLTLLAIVLGLVPATVSAQSVMDKIKAQVDKANRNAEQKSPGSAPPQRQQQPTSPSADAQSNSSSAPPEPVRAKLRIEQGFVNQVENARECANYTMIRVRLFDTRFIGISTPNLVGGLMVMMASGPLDRKETEATHE